MIEGVRGGRRRSLLLRGAETAGGVLLGGALMLSTIVGAAAQATPETGAMASPAAGPCNLPTPPMLPGTEGSPMAMEATAEQSAATPMAEAGATATAAETPAP